MLVASAGNDNTAEPQYPAAHPGVIAIAATDLSDKTAPFSNYGSDIAVSAPRCEFRLDILGRVFLRRIGDFFLGAHSFGGSALLLAVGLDPQKVIADVYLFEAPRYRACASRSADNPTI